MSHHIGWHFPPTGGGSYDGWNDGGIAHFAGKPLANLAREILQNSLDAAVRIGQPVHVEFDLRSLDREDGDHWTQLAGAIDACRTEELADAKAQLALETAATLLEQPEIPCLRVADWHTTGLRDEHFHALVKAKGISNKDHSTAGGSQGQGKSAAFVWSALRTVLYWTRFRQDNQSVELFQGKAVLMSHQHNGRQTQGTGFLGAINQCREISGSDIPDAIRRVEGRSARGDGTSLWIAGFREYNGWQHDIAASVIANFFTALHDGQLEVTIEPDDDMQKYGLLEISTDTLEHWYDYLLNDAKLSDGEDNQLLESHTYWRILSQDQPIEHEDPVLGECQLWIRVADELPSKVAFVRGTGMLITNEQQRLKRFRGLRPFVAVCRFTSQQGNKLLRGMEPPTHDQFEPDWLPETEREHGRAALKRITDWIRAQIKERAAPPPVEVSEEIDELKHLLPIDNPGSFAPPGRSGNSEKAFGRMGAVRLKPIKRVMRLPDPASEPDQLPSEDGDGDDIGNVGGGPSGGGQANGGGGGSGDGDGTGGSGPRGGDRGRPTAELRDVRMLPSDGDARRCRLSFTPEISGAVQLRIEEAGDSNAMKRKDLKVFLNGEKLQAASVNVSAGIPIQIEIRGDEPVNERAWRVLAVQEPAK